MYMARIETHCPSHPYAKVARYFQLRLVNWFRNIQTSIVLLPPPAFEDILRKLEVDDPTWAPTIPVAYLRAPPRAAGATPAGRLPNTATVATVPARPAVGAATPAADLAGHHCRVWRAHRQHHYHGGDRKRRPLATNQSQRTPNKHVRTLASDWPM
jgi:hypothetical protein